MAATASTAAHAEHPEPAEGGARPGQYLGLGRRQAVHRKQHLPAVPGS
jgi:hypothetical protein